MSNPRKWLVFGGGGFLGVHVVREALAAGFEVGVAGRAPPAVGVDARSITFRNCDALVEGDAERAIDAFAPDHVVICAALSTIAECERYPKLAHVLNVEFPRRIAERSRECGAHVVFVSTDLVFGGRAPTAERFTELDEPAPLSEYGRSKCAGESSVLAANEHALIARLPLLFGDSFGRALGASDSLITALRRGGIQSLFDDEWRTPLDVREAARALVSVGKKARTGLRHLAGPERLSRAELGERVWIAAGYSLEEFRSLVHITTRAAAGHSSRPADVSLASVHDRDATLT
ncbi:MAG: sugar nucleotide-binding protein [Planctomycetota bacterium]|nr:sugar nucleotide-binding protein [Planctomycetota bacterium]